jgi:hypothetical protein
MWLVRIGNVWNSSIFISVFHRILDFKNGAEFPFRPLFFLTTDYMGFPDYTDWYQLLGRRFLF